MVYSFSSTVGDHWARDDGYVASPETFRQGYQRLLLAITPLIGRSTDIASDRISSRGDFNSVPPH